MADEIADETEALEQIAREAEPVPMEVGSVSCGLDRMAVRMSEPVDAEAPRPATRDEPYERTPPPEKEHCYRMAWVGSTSIYDQQGKELRTWRCAADANSDPATVARRVAADVARVAVARPGVPIHCVQDGAPELRALPEALTRQLPSGAIPVVLVDFEHLMGYLDDVVDACEAVEDPHDWKGWYRSLLLRDDAAIDPIWRKLRSIAKTLKGRGTKERNAVAAALSYIRRRKSKMQYATHYAANLPIGSGATESTCWQMQQRVKLPGQSWEACLRGILAMRGLALSDRWLAAWQPLRREVPQGGPSRRMIRIASALAAHRRPLTPAETQSTGWQSSTQQRLIAGHPTRRSTKSAWRGNGLTTDAIHPGSGP